MKEEPLILIHLYITAKLCIIETGLLVKKNTVLTGKLTLNGYQSETYNQSHPQAIPG